MISAGSEPIQLLSSAELAEIFGVEERTLLDWRLKYGWPCVRVGRRVRFTPAMVEQILAAHSESGKKSDDDGAGVAIAGQSKGSAARSRRTA